MKNGAGSPKCTQDDAERVLRKMVGDALTSQHCTTLLTANFILKNYHGIFPFFQTPVFRLTDSLQDRCAAAQSERKENRKRTSHELTKHRLWPEKSSLPSTSNHEPTNPIKKDDNSKEIMKLS